VRRNRTPVGRKSRRAKGAVTRKRRVRGGFEPLRVTNALSSLSNYTVPSVGMSSRSSERFPRIDHVFTVALIQDLDERELIPTDGDKSPNTRSPLDFPSNREQPFWKPINIGIERIGAMVQLI
jgi:hypothetical protein